MNISVALGFFALFLLLTSAVFAVLSFSVSRAAEVIGHEAPFVVRRISGGTDGQIVIVATNRQTASNGACEEGGTPVS